MLPITGKEFFEGVMGEAKGLEKLLVSKGCPTGTQIYFGWYFPAFFEALSITVIASPEQFSMIIMVSNTVESVIAALVGAGETVPDFEVPDGEGSSLFLEQLDLPIELKPMFEQKMLEFNPYHFKDVQGTAADGMSFHGHAIELGVRLHTFDIGWNIILKQMPEHYLYFEWLLEFAMPHSKHPLAIACLKHVETYLW